MGQNKFGRTKLGFDQIWLDQKWVGPKVGWTKFGLDQIWPTKFGPTKCVSTKYGVYSFAIACLIVDTNLSDIVLWKGVAGVANIHFPFYFSSIGPLHNTSTRLIGAATAKDAWLILFWFLRQFYVIKRQIAAESMFFKFFSIIWKPSQASYALTATVALCTMSKFVVDIM